jgi:hypothetical protein
MKRFFSFALVALISGFLVAVPASTPAQATGRLCIVTAYKPHIVLVGQPYKDAVSGVGASECNAQWPGQQVRVRLQEYNYGTNKWDNRSVWNYSPTTTGPTSTWDYSYLCSTVGVGKYRTYAQGLSGGQSVGTDFSDGVILCN